MPPWLRASYRHFQAWTLRRLFTHWSRWKCVGMMTTVGLLQDVMRDMLVDLGDVAVSIVWEVWLGKR